MIQAMRTTSTIPTPSLQITTTHAKGMRASRGKGIGTVAHLEIVETFRARLFSEFMLVRWCSGIEVFIIVRLITIWRSSSRKCGSGKIMFFANSMLGQKIHIDDAETGVPYFCPACNSAMVQKRGNINAHHFAHKAWKGCDPWYTEKLSPWHIEMQNHFDKVAQEIVVWNETHTEYHIADIVLQSDGQKYVIEFQHSPISQKEFVSRTKFYLKCGYIVIWVFDFFKCKSQKTIFVSEYKSGIIHLVWPGKDRVKFLDNIDFTSVNERLHIFFYINTGMGRIQLHDPEGYYPWKTWEYVNPFSMHSCFALLCLDVFDNTRDFFAEYFSEEAFFRAVKSLGK